MRSRRRQQMAAGQLSAALTELGGHCRQYGRGVVAPSAVELSVNLSFRSLSARRDTVDVDKFAFALLLLAVIRHSATISSAAYMRPGAGFSRRAAALGRRATGYFALLSQSARLRRYIDGCWEGYDLLGFRLFRRHDFIDADDCRAMPDFKWAASSTLLSPTSSGGGAPAGDAGVEMDGRAALWFSLLSENISLARGRHCRRRVALSNDAARRRLAMPIAYGAVYQ